MSGAYTTNKMIINKYKIVVEIPERKTPLGDLGINRTIISNGF
jgi:hypothetical protein